MATGQYEPTFQVAELIEAFRLQSKTGVLKVLYGNQRGALYIVNGRLIDATLSPGLGAAELAPAEALRQISAWDNPTFVVRQDPLIAMRPERISHDDDWNELTLDTPVQATGDVPADALLGAASWLVLARITAGEHLRVIAAEVDPSGFQVLAAAGELLRAGLIEPAVAAFPSLKLLYHHALLARLDPMSIQAESAA